jgi:hypothetical protein
MQTNSSLLFASLALFFLPSMVNAQTSEPGHVSVGLSTYLSPTGEFDALGGRGFSLDGRWVFVRGLQVGAMLEGSQAQQVFISGLALLGGRVLEARLVGLAPIYRTGPLAMSLRFRTGGSWLTDIKAEDSSPGTGIRWVADLSLFASVELRERWSLRVGPTIGIELEVSPTVEMADQAQLILAGVGYTPRPGLLLYSNVEGGGSLGFNGDNEKVLARATLGLRIDLGSKARSMF